MTTDQEKKDIFRAAVATDQEKDIFRAAMATLDVKTGDMVRVFSAWPDYGIGWAASWTCDMDSFIGLQGRVVLVDDGYNGVQVDLPEAGERDAWWFPPYVLRKVRTAKSILTEEEKYSAAVGMLALVVGDTVTVTGSWPSNHGGWKNVWVDTMDKFVDQKCRVVDIDSGQCEGIRLTPCDGSEIGFRFPPYVVRKVPGTSAQPAPKGPKASEATLFDEFVKAALTGLLSDSDRRGYSKLRQRRCCFCERSNAATIGVLEGNRMNQTILNEHRRVLAESARLWREIALSETPWEKPEWAYNAWVNGCACCQYTFDLIGIDETPRNEGCRVLCPASPLWRGEYCQHSKALYDRWVCAGEGETYAQSNRRAALQMSWGFQALFNDMAQCVGDDDA